MSSIQTKFRTLSAVLYNFVAAGVMTLEFAKKFADVQAGGGGGYLFLKTVFSELHVDQY